jgi:hypothetical protein
MGQYGQASVPAAKRYVGRNKMMNFTKFQLFAAGSSAVAIQFISLVPNRRNIIAFILLACLTIQPLLTMKRNFKIISAILLVYFIAMGAEQYRRGVEYEKYMATNPVQKFRDELK